MAEVRLIGWVASDVTMIPNSGNLGVFPLLTERELTGKNGKKSVKQNIHRIIVLEKNFKEISNALKEGMEVMVEGLLNYRLWSDDKQIERKETEIVLTEYQILGQKKYEQLKTKELDEACSWYKQNDKDAS